MFMVKVRTRGQGTHNVHFKSSQLMNTRLCVCVCVFQSSPLYVRAQRTEIRAEQLRNHVYSLEEETKTKVFLISHCSTGFLQLCLLVLLHIFNRGQTSSSAACVSVCVTISSPCHTCRQWFHGWQPLCPEHFLV